jgi:hypothetical protein
VDKNNELPQLMLGSVKLDFKKKLLDSISDMRSAIQFFSFSNINGALGSMNYNVTEYSNLIHYFCKAVGSRRSLSFASAAK